MEELEVEAVDAIDPPRGVDAPEIVLYGGKGGVGKTTMAAATGLASARDGTATLVVSTDPAHSIADIFERPVSATPTRIDEEYPLFATEIDPDSAMAEGLGALGAMTGGDHPLGELLGGAVMPGADEAVGLQVLMQYLDDDRFDRIVVDTAPTGHTLRLLSLPELMDTMVGRLLRLQERMSGLFDGMSGLFGEENADPEELAGLQDMSDQIEQLRAILQDPAKTDFRVVMVPESMSVAESNRLLDELTEVGIPVETIVVNRVMEELSSLVPEADDNAFVHPDLEGCEFCRQRWEVQREALTQAHELFRGRAVKRVPLFASEVRGDRMLRLVASCLD